MADVSIDGSIGTSTGRGVRGIVWHPTDLDIGYSFFVDSDNDFSYAKTTDGGVSWGAAVQIGPNDTDLAFDVWADWWTPGDSGTLIHLVWFGTTLDDVLYRNLDISTDTLGTQVVVEAEASAVAGVGTYCSITKARGGNLYVVWELDASGERGFERSTDGGATWAARTSPQEALGDYAMLFPANLADSQDIWALYFDASASALTLKTHDDSGNSWAESASIATVTRTVTTDLLVQYPFSASVRHSDGHLIDAVCTERDTSTADHRVFDITNGSTITEKTAITTNIDDHYYPSVFIDQATDDIYVAYNGKRDGSETLNTATKVYYTKSTDGGANWSAGDTAYMEGTAGVVVQTWAPLMGPRFYVSWRVGSTLLGNAVNSVSLGPITGDGALVAAAASVDGAGVSSSIGSGALSAQSSTIDGAGVSASVGTGSLSAQEAAISGEGTVGDTGITGTGALVAGDAAVDGAGLSLSTGSGDLAAQAAALDGAGVSASVGTGAMAAQASVVDGVGVSESTGSGALIAGDASIHGSQLETITGSGALQAQAASLSGIGTVADAPDEVVPGRITVGARGPSRRLARMREFLDLIDEAGILVARRGRAPAKEKAAKHIAFLSSIEEAIQVTGLPARGVCRARLVSERGSDHHRALRARRGLPSKEILWFIREVA